MHSFADQVIEDGKDFVRETRGRKWGKDWLEKAD
jgi:hypothetical protein